MSISNTEKRLQLDVEKAVSLLASNGPMAMALKGFEARAEQQKMMRNVLEAYNCNRIALIEAGTGTGKSLAYLIPAMLWAAQAKERTLISTNTITLQEQLLQKDIPLIENALNLNVHAVLVKGMHNYLCIRKLEELHQEILLLPPNEAEELQKIDAWKNYTCDGSRTSLSFSPSPALWEKVAAESDTCNRNNCPYYQNCYFFKARRQASEAQILIANHHLLFADLVRRAENENYKDIAILPPYSRIILDEAHNIEDIATEYFAKSVSHMDIIKITARLASERGGKIHGKLPQIKEKLSKLNRNEFSNEVSSIYNRLNTDLPGMRRDILHQTQVMFEGFSEFIKINQGISDLNFDDHTNTQGLVQSESKLRILPYHQTHPYWNDRLLPFAKQLIETIQKYAQALKALEKDLKGLKETSFEEQIRGILFDILALGLRLENFAALIERFINEKTPPSKVRWIELQTFKSMMNISLIDADLDISQLLSNYLFKKFETVILCSATLTTNNHFHFIRKRIGLHPDLLPQRTVTEHIYDSPFDFVKQALLAIPTDIPSPEDSSFINEASEKIWSILQASRGNAFVLFTSFTMLNQCYDRLEKRLLEFRFNPLKQGNEERQVLLNKFKSKDHSVLFGTDSFWEGVDVAGEALRCVIIVKLPFKVPSEPIIQARTHAIQEQGGNPFMEYSLPQAIVKFKQGFGRLIRHRHDRGCIVCLDNRIITKKYGSLFLNSLPQCQQLFLPGDQLQQQMTEFYRKTHHLVSK